MKLARRIFWPSLQDAPAAGAVSPASGLCDILAPGIWAMEAGCAPPAAHWPSRLVARRAAHGCLAVSLRTGTLLSLELGQIVASRLESAGCRLAPLAGLALHEVLVNAAIHGNLQVDAGPAAGWCDLSARERLVAAALGDPPRAARVVTVAAGWNAEEVFAIVIDEGAGYVPLTPQPQAGASRRAAGRGLLIARAEARVDVLRGGRCTRLIFGHARPAIQG
jgi:hypothetical protein